MSKALLIVDFQNDFCPGGALAVKNADEIVDVLNRYIEYFTAKDFPVLVSRDWHPRNSHHFEENGGDWPVHCVRNTEGAEFHPDLLLPSDIIVISKGMSPDEDGYSAFEGRDDAGLSLKDVLDKNEIEELYVGGLATDYCVKNTVLDGLKNYRVYLLGDATRGVNLEPDDSRKAVEAMVRAGAEEITFAKLP
ncbi:MAG: bifunctional nicotinamidase/pyrazinamidase [Candidatus Omnitrophota bacterium]